MQLGMWRFAVLFAASALGAGAASGVEWLRFFSFYGTWGTCGLVLGTAGLAWLGYRAAAISHVRSLASYREWLEHVLGPAAGSLFSPLLYTLVLAYCGLVAGQAASALSAATSLSHAPAALLVCTVACWLSQQRLEWLARCSAWFLLIIAFYLALLFAEPRHIPIPSLTYQLNGGWAWHSLLFVAKHFLLVLVLAVPIAIGTAASDQLRRGAWVGMALLLTMAGGSHLAILAYWHEVHSSDAPLADIVHTAVPFGPVLYTGLAAWEAILTVALYLHALANVTAGRMGWNPRPTVTLYALMILLFTGAAALGEAYRVLVQEAMTYTGLAVLLAFLRKFGQRLASRRPT